MPKYTDVYEMGSSLLVMEFKRLTELEAKGETDESVSYSAFDLEDQITFRLKEYDLDR